MTTTFPTSRLTLLRLIKVCILSLAAGYALSGSAAPLVTEKKVPQEKLVQEEKAAPEKAQTQKATSDDDKKGRLPLEELRTFTEVMQRIKSAYVEEVDDKTLLENAIQGMLSGLDPHSAYLKSEDFKELEINTSGEFGGLGIEVGMENGFIKVIAPIDDTPAQKAGIKAGDLIIKLDGESVKGMTLTRSLDKMRGKPGTDIKLTIIREGVTKPIELTIKRDIIKVTSVKSRMIEDGYGYIRLSQFQSDTDKEVVEHIKKMKQSQKAPLKGLVLDLRNNPGGVLQSAVGVVEAFINKGLIVYTEGRIPSSHLKFTAEKEDLSGGVPLVVLIDGGSASASEIVAGALQDHRRAVIMGTQSFGKGSVQTVMPLGAKNDKGLKLTTAFYYTPNGRSIQAEGIKPDIIIPKAKVTPVEAAKRYKEADLQGHLNNNGDSRKKADRKADKQKTSNTVKPSAPEEKPLVETDYQLSQALNVLKGMHIGKQGEAKQKVMPEKVATTKKRLTLFPQNNRSDN